MRKKDKKDLENAMDHGVLCVTVNEMLTAVSVLSPDVHLNAFK